MPEAHEIWQGDEWQEYSQRLLKHHYGPGSYQEVPDTHSGDLGIEGFSMDGCAFQCYAVEGLLDTNTTYERQRDKITADIGKFIRNEKELAQMFGTMRISRWIFMVPDHVSRKLNAHAATKTAEVHAAAPTHTAADFRIVIVTDAHFEVARKALVESGAARVRLVTPTIDESIVDRWKDQTAHSTLLATMDEKLKKIPRLEDDAKRSSFAQMLVRRFLEGQAFLTSLSENYPMVYARAAEQKRAQEEMLVTKSGIGASAAPVFFEEQLNRIREELETSLSNVPPTQIVLLANEAVADWLMRCPLDF